MISPKEIESKLSSIKPYLKNQYHIGKLGYFGSFAHGDYNENSDLDVIVEFNDRVGWEFFELKDYLEKIVGLKVDLVTKNSIKERWRNRILNEVKYIW